MPDALWIAAAVTAVVVAAALASRASSRRFRAALAEVARRHGGSVSSGSVLGRPVLRLDRKGDVFTLGTFAGSSEAASSSSSSFVDVVLDPPAACSFTLERRSVQSSVDRALLGKAIHVSDPRLRGWVLRGDDETAVREALRPEVLEPLLACPGVHVPRVTSGLVRRHDGRAWRESMVVSVAVEPASSDPVVLEWLLARAEGLARAIPRRRA